MAPGPVIVDYGMGNLASVANAFARLGVEARISSEPDRLMQAGGIVLPGVGAFGDAMRRLRDTGLADALQRAVIGQGVPFLGICLGMQLIAEGSEEDANEPGLGWIGAQVKRIPEAPARQVPHVGWNDLHYAAGEPMFAGVAEGAHYYFDHSYEVACPDELVVAYVDYEDHRITAALRRGHILAAQFHPEKSQNNGLRLFRNFLRVASEHRPQRAAC